MTTTTANPINTNWLDTLGHALRNNRLIQILTGLLLIQVLVAGVIGLQRSGTNTVDSAEPLFSFAKEDVTQLEISDETQSVQLTRQGDSWSMGPDNALPVDTDRAATLLTSLENLNPGLPVASTPNAREQLKVADDDFQRKLTISAGDAKTDLLLGTSPGIRKSHVRLEGSDNIYSIALPESELSASVDAWLDKSLLSFSEIAKIKSGELTFELHGEGDDRNWTMVNSDGESKEIDTDKIDGLVNSLENLLVNGVAEKLDPKSDVAKDQKDTDSTELESLDILISTDNAEVTLVIEKLGDNATAHREDIDGIYSISTALFDDLSSLGNKENLVTDNREQGAVETE